MWLETPWYTFTSRHRPSAATATTCRRAERSFVGCAVAGRQRPTSQSESAGLVVKLSAAIVCLLISVCWISSCWYYDEEASSISTKCHRYHAYVLHPSGSLFIFYQWNCVRVDRWAKWSMMCFSPFFVECPRLQSVGCVDPRAGRRRRLIVHF